MEVNTSKKPAKQEQNGEREADVKTSKAGDTTGRRLPAEDAVKAHLHSLIAAADLETETERKLRKKLEEHFGCELRCYKQLIRSEIEAWLQSHATPSDDEAEEEDDSVEKAQTVPGTGHLSPELQRFLGVERMARTDVVKKIWDYIKGNGLQDPSNRRNIMVDDRLSSLFRAPLDMFSMNKQLSKHVFGDGGVKKMKGKRKAESDESKPKKAAKPPKPCKLTPELAEFVGVPEMSRPQLTKFFWQYFKDNNLLSGAMVAGDAKLVRLFGKEATSFKGIIVSKFINQHIVKD